MKIKNVINLLISLLPNKLKTKDIWICLTEIFILKEGICTKWCYLEEENRSFALSIINLCLPRHILNQTVFSVLLSTNFHLRRSGKVQLRYINLKEEVLQLLKSLVLKSLPKFLSLGNQNFTSKNKETLGVCQSKLIKISVL